MARGKRHPDAVRAEVIAALLTGQSIDEVAQRYHLPRGTVAVWAHKSKGVDPDSEVGEMVSSYLVTLLETLREVH